MEGIFNRWITNVTWTSTDLCLHRGNQYTVANEKLFNLANLNSPKNQSELIVDIKSVRMEVRCVFIIIVGIMEFWRCEG
jgi:small-conductance mechanosensitive channel